MMKRSYRVYIYLYSKNSNIFHPQMCLKWYFQKTLKIGGHFENQIQIQNMASEWIAE